MSVDSERLAIRIAREVGIGDWLRVEEAVRRRHRILFLDYEHVEPEEYEAPRDSIEADLMGSGDQASGSLVARANSSARDSA